MSTNANSYFHSSDNLYCKTQVSVFWPVTNISEFLGMCCKRINALLMATCINTDYIQDFISYLNQLRYNWTLFKGLKNLHTVSKKCN